MNQKRKKKDPTADSHRTGETASNLSLRKLAEKKIRDKTDNAGYTTESMPPDETQGLLHELEVHQVELEMQNFELLRIQEELEKSRLWYFDLYNSAPVGYFTLSEAGLITEANFTASSILDVNVNSLSGYSFAGFVHSEFKDIFYLRQLDLFATGISQQYDLKISKNDNSSLWIRMVTTLFYGENNQPVCRAVMSDITALKFMEEEKNRLEEQTMHNRRLESLGILAGGIAHNFNNLLTGIFGYIELAARKTSNPDVSRYLNEALDMSERAKSLTGRLLTFSRGGFPLKKTGHLFPLISDSVKFALTDSDIACSFDLQDNLDPCNFDQNQIVQVINDLILNARQAMPHGGAIEISAHNVLLDNNDIADLPEGGYIRISVKDSGTGMSPETLAKVFDPFFTTKNSGYGLGLTTVHSIISRHGGSVIIESEPGEGSLVAIYLPSVLEFEPPPVQNVYSEHRGNGTIIVMDDEELIKISLSEMLKSMGYDVIQTGKGEEVLSLLKDKGNRTYKIAGFILDLKIPGGIGGKETVSEIRKILPDIPVFAISGYSEDPVIINPGEYGFTGSLGKPFRMSELAEMLNKTYK